MSQNNRGRHGGSNTYGKRSWRGRGKNQYRRGQGRSGPVGNNSLHNSQSSQPSQVSELVSDHHSPYKGWHLYFPTEAFSENSPTDHKIQVFERYFQNWKSIYDVRDIEAKGFVTVDYKQLCADQIIAEEFPQFGTDLRQMPENIINCLGLAIYQVVFRELERDQEESNGQSTGTSSSGSAVNLSKVRCHIAGFEPITPLKLLKANYYGKFVSVKGTVVRVTSMKPLCTRMAFACTTCSNIQVQVLLDRKYNLPTKCPTDSCRGRTFLPRLSHPLTQTIEDCQSARVQEIINDDHRESGRIPRTVDCELNNELVDSCVPGDVVTVSGVVKVVNSEEGRARQKDRCMFLLYLHSNNVTNTQGSKGSGEPGTGLAMDFTMKELYAVEEIQSEQNLFRLLVMSLCPTIYGHEIVKAGLVLGLFGGSQKFANDKNRIPVRGDPHILIVGDPGLGKSQMLQAAANVAPRSVYVCGNTTTTSGLTVTISKESGGGGDYALEAGALVLADQGCCCIDEFDKMGCQHQALLEAMEQQSISIAKAGIVCSLPARTSILAAANPVGGHFNKSKTVSENLRMGSALLSRFDLVFILLDKPDEEMDSIMSEHVMALHEGKKRVTIGTPAMATPQSTTEVEARAQWEADKPLSERLKPPRTQPLDPLPPQLFRKYVGYARKYVHPKITQEAAAVLQSFYLDLRKKHQTQDSTPITTRQLESLIRLTEARARLELREEATEQDAKDVVEIMKYSMMDTYMDEMGFLDFNRSQHGSGMSSKSQAKKFISILQRQAEQNYNSLFTVQEMRQIIKESGIQVRDFENFVTSLNNQGYLLQKGPRVYQLQTAGF